MKKILMHMNFKRFFSVELKEKKDSSSDSGTPELYYDTNVVYEVGMTTDLSDEIWVTEESDENGETVFHLRVCDKEISMQDVDRMQLNQQNWEKKKKWETAKAVGKFALAVASILVSDDVSVLSSFLSGWEIGDTYQKNVGDDRSFDKKSFLEANTFEYKSGSVTKSVILSGFCSDVKLEMVPEVIMGTSRNCPISVIKKNCVSVRSDGDFEKIKGYDCYKYGSFEFYSAKDAKAFFKQLKKCLKEVKKRQR